MKGACMFRFTAIRSATLVLAVCGLLAAVPSEARKMRGQERRSEGKRLIEAALQAIPDAWALLKAVWDEEGSSLDPFGNPKPQGSSLDPFGDPGH
jgi:hypothetical protein